MKPRTGLRLAVLIGWIVAAAGAQAQDAALVRSKAMRDAFISEFRITGAMDPGRLAPAVSEMEALVATTAGPEQARALLELGILRRLGFDLPSALMHLRRAAGLAHEFGLRDVEYDAWINVVRATVAGPRDHGAAAQALERAENAAGPQPTPKQQFELLSYQGQLKAVRGESESAMVDAAASILLATEPLDRYYAEWELAGALTDIAKSCDYRTVRDARSADDKDDQFGACRRAVSAAGQAFSRAASIADGSGWRFMADMSRRQMRNLAVREQVIASRDRFLKLQADNANIFTPRSARDVLVGQEFFANSSALTEIMPLINQAVSQMVADADTLSGRPSASSQYLKAILAEARSGKPDAAIELFAVGTSQLSRERGSFFDPRRRGTAIEGGGEVVREMALRLLSAGREAEAFAAFEAVRARGLGELTTLLDDPNVTAAERAWLASVVLLDAEASAIEQRIAESIIATGRPETGSSAIQRLQTARVQKRAVLASNEPARARFAGQTASPAGLNDLRAASAQAGIPVLLYWTTPANLIGWYVGPQGSVPRSIFLPEGVLIEKIRRIQDTVVQNDPDRRFDEATARELFLFLISPFADLLDTKQVLIIPQGALLGLPFETLLNPASGQPLIEQWAVSYAPNATMAVRALRQEPRGIRHVAVLADPALALSTQELKRIEASGALISAARLSDRVLAFDRADALHGLTHGRFDAFEPLLSELENPVSPIEPVRAADMLAWPLRDLPLVVLSACEGSRVGTRISNEIFGFPWALLAGGAHAVVLSRWRVDADSNSVWMQVFYQAAARGDSPAIAAAHAMRAMRKAGFGHPYHWAAMQVTGR